MNYTQNYKLNQWEASDRVLRTDFNADNAKIDAALKTQAEVLESETAKIRTALAGKGNCTVRVGTHVGTGREPLSLELGDPLPRLTLIWAANQYVWFIPGQTKAGLVSDSRVSSLSLTWSETGVKAGYTSDGSAPFNQAGQTYTYFAFYF